MILLIACVSAPLALAGWWCALSAAARLRAAEWQAAENARRAMQWESEARRRSAPAATRPVPSVQPDAFDAVAGAAWREWEQA